MAVLVYGSAGEVPDKVDGLEERLYETLSFLCFEAVNIHNKRGNRTR